MIVPGRGQQRVGVLGVDADFDGVAIGVGGVGGQVERFAGGDAQLPLDEVEAGDHLGDGVLDLQAGVHLEEVEVAVRLGEAFDGAGVVVAEGLDRLDGAAGEAGAEVGRDGGAGRFLDHLLVAALDGAVALTQVADGAVVVGEDLDLDVARAEHLALEVEVVAAEGTAGEGAGALDGAGELAGARDDRHADAAAAAAGLDDQRVADLGGGAFEVVVGEVALGAGDEREAPLAHRGAGLVLVAHEVDVVAAGADEGDAARGAGAGGSRGSRRAGRSRGGRRRSRRLRAASRTASMLR